MRHSIDTYVRAIENDNKQHIIDGGYESVADYIISNAESSGNWYEFFDEDEYENEPSAEQIGELKEYLNKYYNKKEVVCYLNDAVRKCIIKAEGGFDGWRVPLFAEYDEENKEVALTVGEQVSAGTCQPDAFEVWNCDCWERCWKEEDAEAWAAECGHEPEEFDCEECFSGEIYEREDRFLLKDENTVKESIREHFPLLNINFE